MLPRRIVFATNASRFSGAGHIRRLIEISRALPCSIEKYFFGSIEVDWVKELAEKAFIQLDSVSDFERYDLVILDSYEEDFCLRVDSEFPNSRIIQIADRYTFLLADSAIIFLDLPFPYQDSSIKSRVIAHGIEYLPMRSFAKHVTAFAGRAKKVLVSTGGSVNKQIFSELVEELVKAEYKDVSFEFIGLYGSCKSEYFNLNFHNFGHGFDSIAGGCDTAISAAGTTMWDLFANRKLVGLTAMVENQVANFDYAIKNEQALDVFDPRTLKLNIEALQSLLFDSSIRQSLYNATLGKYDFNGAKRVVGAILTNSQ